MKAYKCLICGHQLSSDVGIWNHIKKKHNIKPPIHKGIHYDLADKAQQIPPTETKIIEVSIPLVLRIRIDRGEVKTILTTEQSHPQKPLPIR